MSITRLRQQGGAVILTIPSNLISKMNWSIGMELNITTENESLCIAPSRRIPRGRKSVSQLVSEIDTHEIEFLNKSMDELNNSPSVGKEIFNG